MTVRYLKWITRDMLRDNPGARFVFGDNVERVGLGGQAAAMRGEANAIGVATLYAPGQFYDANPLALMAVTGDLLEVAEALSDGRLVFVPADGLGTGLGRLREHRPDIHNLIVTFFRAADGEPCPWELA